MREVRPALLLLLVLTSITGVLYPLVVTGIAQLAFPRQAGGSLIVRGQQVVGSSLIGQAFRSPRYFWSRLSATSPPYNAGASSGSNLGPLDPALIAAVQTRIDSLRAEDLGAALPVPADLVTSSASGLDPHISPAAAAYQVRRVALARGIGEDDVRALVHVHTAGRWLGFIGEPVVNVLELNLALDERAARRTP
jgi:potassium-transporting ATPase KdpC subunit